MKKLFDPEDNREVLRGWEIHANKGRDKHELAARQYQTLYRRVGTLSVVLSTVAGASVFGSFERAFEPWSRILAGLISITASVLAGALTFRKYEEVTEKHRSAGVKYKAAIRRLEEELSASRVATVPRETVAAIRGELDQLETLAPVVPDRVNQEVETMYQEYGFIDKASELRRK